MTQVGLSTQADLKQAAGAVIVHVLREKTVSEGTNKGQQSRQGF